MVSEVTPVFFGGIRILEFKQKSLRNCHTRASRTARLGLQFDAVSLFDLASIPDDVAKPEHPLFDFLSSVMAVS
jgi:hypothetical protein